MSDLADIMEQFKNKSIFIYGTGSYETAIYHTFSKYGVKVNTFLDIKAQPGDILFEIPMYKADDKLLDIKKKKKLLLLRQL